jgi:hypothetical protein
MPPDLHKESDNIPTSNEVKSTSFLDSLPTSKLKQALQDKIKQYRQLAQGPVWSPEDALKSTTVLKELLYLDSIVEYEEIN